MTGRSSGGTDGRVIEQDVRRAADDGPTRRTTPATAAPPAYRTRLRSIRRSTARRVSRAWRDIPHAVHRDLIDITALERLRRRQAGEVEAAGAKLTVTSYLLKVLASALQAHPSFNATFDAEKGEIEIKQEVNIGVALDSARGLLVPVLGAVDRRSLLDIAVELDHVATLLRDGNARGGILKGGTFTLTNVGALGGTDLSPIINAPQVAIFGAARAELRHVVRGDLDHHASEVALMLPVCMAFDHRVIDGADAARFTNTVKGLLAEPSALILRT